MRIVLVEWDDPLSCNQWEPRDVFLHPRPCVSTGIITDENEKEIEITLSINSMSKSNSLAIPRGAIKRIRNVKIKED